MAETQKSGGQPMSSDPSPGNRPSPVSLAFMLGKGSNKSYVSMSIRKIRVERNNGAPIHLLCFADSQNGLNPLANYVNGELPDLLHTEIANQTPAVLRSLDFDDIMKTSMGLMNHKIGIKIGQDSLSSASFLSNLFYVAVIVTEGKIHVGKFGLDDGVDIFLATSELRRTWVSSKSRECSASITKMDRYILVGSKKLTDRLIDESHSKRLGKYVRGDYEPFSNLAAKILRNEPFPGDGQLNTGLLILDLESLKEDCWLPEYWLQKSVLAIDQKQKLFYSQTQLSENEKPSAKKFQLLHTFHEYKLISTYRQARPMPLENVGDLAPPQSGDPPMGVQDLPAIAGETQDPETGNSFLFLLTNSNFQNSSSSGAVANSRKVHLLPVTCHPWMDRKFFDRTFEACKIPEAAAAADSPAISPRFVVFATRCGKFVCKFTEDLRLFLVFSPAPPYQNLPSEVIHFPSYFGNTNVPGLETDLTTTGEHPVSSSPPPNHVDDDPMNGQLEPVGDCEEAEAESFPLSLSSSSLLRSSSGSNPNQNDTSAKPTSISIPTPPENLVLDPIPKENETRTIIPPSQDPGESSSVEERLASAVDSIMPGSPPQNVGSSEADLEQTEGEEGVGATAAAEITPQETLDAANALLNLMDGVDESENSGKALPPPPQLSNPSSSGNAQKSGKTKSLNGEVSDRCCVLHPPPNNATTNPDGVVGGKLRRTRKNARVASAAAGRAGSSHYNSRLNTDNRNIIRIKLPKLDNKRFIRSEATVAQTETDNDNPPVAPQVHHHHPDPEPESSIQPFESYALSCEMASAKPSNNQISPEEPTTPQEKIGTEMEVSENYPLQDISDIHVPIVDAYIPVPDNLGFSLEAHAPFSSTTANKANSKTPEQRLESSFAGGVAPESTEPSPLTPNPPPASVATPGPSSAIVTPTLLQRAVPVPGKFRAGASNSIPRVVEQRAAPNNTIKKITRATNNPVATGGAPPTVTQNNAVGTKDESTADPSLFLVPQPIPLTRCKSSGGTLIVPQEYPPPPSDMSEEDSEEEEDSAPPPRICKWSLKRQIGHLRSGRPLKNGAVAVAIVASASTTNHPVALLTGGMKHHCLRKTGGNFLTPNFVPIATKKFKPSEAFVPGSQQPSSENYPPPGNPQPSTCSNAIIVTVPQLSTSSGIQPSFNFTIPLNNNNDNRNKGEENIQPIQIPPVAAAPQPLTSSFIRASFNLINNEEESGTATGNLAMTTAQPSTSTLVAVPSSPNPLPAATTKEDAQATIIPTTGPTCAGNQVECPTDSGPATSLKSPNNNSTQAITPARVAVVATNQPQNENVHPTPPPRNGQRLPLERRTTRSAGGILMPFTTLLQMNSRLERATTVKNPKSNK